MELKIRDIKTGIVYSSNMDDNNKNVILSMNFCTSYTEVEVQEETEVGGKKKFPTHTVILPPFGSDPSWTDLIATQEDNKGEWVSCI